MKKNIIKLLSFIEKIMDKIARYGLLFIFLIIFILSLFIKAMYSFDDSPYFENPNLYDFCMGLFVVLLIFLLYRFRNILQNKINYKICFVIFLILSITYIVLIPTKPFSDMRAVYEGAIKFSHLNIEELLNDEYWDTFSGNIRLAVFWGVLVFPLPKKLITFKIINAIMIYFIAYFSCRLSKEMGLKYYNIIYLLILTFLPSFLYINHVYYDIPLIFFVVIGLYIYKKYSNILFSFCMFGIGYFLRKNALIFMLAVSICYIFNCKYYEKKINIKRIIELVIAIIIFYVIYFGGIKLAYSNIAKDNFKSYPSWNEYYIGLNEEKIGFQNFEFSYDRSYEDVINRIEEYGPQRLAKILTKKTFWLWSQGTYQAQRYAFGVDTENALEKFEYETFLTKYLLKDSQKLRKVINAFMRSQYLVLFALMIVTMLNGDTDIFREIYYVIIATVIAMLIYELKSRYILHIYPLMIIMSGKAFEIIENRDLIKRKIHNKCKS